MLNLFQHLLANIVTPVAMRSRNKFGMTKYKLPDSDYSNEIDMYYVYIMTNKNNTVLYVGMTNNIQRRVYEHKYGMGDGFTKRYRLNKLVYLEQTEDVRSAIEREKQIKRWHRVWKVEMVSNANPKWKDMTE